MRDFVEGVEEGILGELPGMEMEERRAPAVGDEANLIGVDVEDLGVSMYILSFRKVNVIGVVVVMGTDAAATEAAAAEFGKNMDAKIR
jgi:hypothetical protein